MTSSQHTIQTLRRLARRETVKPLHKCELCAARIADEHAHLLDLGTRQLVCACDACAVLFSGSEQQRYRRVPRRVLRVDDVEFTDARLADTLWQTLSIPIRLAFVYRNSVVANEAGSAGSVVAVFPSPGGAIESNLSADVWLELSARSAAISRMKSDVEALLINHVRNRRDCFIVSIDECYRLVGMVRSNWHGFGGGDELWRLVDEFFDDLHRRAQGAPGGRSVA